VSKNRKPSEVDVIYDDHMNAGRSNGGFRRNPNMDRTAIIERMYTRILTEMAVNRFKWTGLEETGIDIRFMELTLLRYGLSVVFKHYGTNRILAVQGAPAGPMNWAQNPTQFVVTGNMMRSKTIAAKHVVPIWSNYLRTPDTDIIYIYAKRLAELDRTIEMASDNARRPVVAFTNENQRLSVMNMIRQVQEGNPVIQVNSEQYESLDNIIKTVDFGSDPDAIEKLDIVRTRVWGTCMGLLGFDFANTEKKERVQAAEVDANNSQVDSMRFVNLNARRQACDLMNERFNLNAKVEYHVTSESSAAQIMPAVGGGI